LALHNGRQLHRPYKIQFDFRGVKMTSIQINWDEVPDTISKEQMCRICHISNNTARRLLLEGIVPCEYTGKKSKCFSIKKEDLRTFVEIITKHKRRKGCPNRLFIYSPRSFSRISLNLSGSSSSDMLLGMAVEPLDFAVS